MLVFCASVSLTIYLAKKKKKKTTLEWARGELIIGLSFLSSSIVEIMYLTR